MCAHSSLLMQSQRNQGQWSQGEKPLLCLPDTLATLQVPLCASCSCLITRPVALLPQVSIHLLGENPRTTFMDSHGIPVVAELQLQLFQHQLPVPEFPTPESGPRCPRSTFTTIGYTVDFIEPAPVYLGARALNRQRSLGFVPSIQLSIIATLGVNDFFFLLLHKEGYYLKIKENKQLYFFRKFIDQISLYSGNKSHFILGKPSRITDQQALDRHWQIPQGANSTIQWLKKISQQLEYVIASLISTFGFGFIKVADAFIQSITLF